MEELIKEIRLLREEVAGLRKAVESRANRGGAWKAKKLAEALLNDFMDGNERKVVGMALSRVNWLQQQGKPVNFDEGLIVNLLKKQGISVEGSWVMDILRKMMMRNILSWEGDKNGEWFWKFGTRTEEALSKLDEEEKKAFFKAVYFSSNSFEKP